MATLTKRQIKEIIDNAPEGTSPAGVVAALRSKGHILEGYDGAKIEEEQTSPLFEFQKGLEGSPGVRYFLKPMSKLLGIQALTEQVGKAGTRIGTAAAFLDPSVRQQAEASTENFEFITGQSVSQKQELKKVAGETLKAAAAPITAKLAPVARPFVTGAVSGAIGKTAERLEEGDDLKDMILPVTKQAVSSGALSSIFSKILLGSEEKAARLFGRAFKPSPRELQSQIEKGKELTTSKLAREGYVGTLTQIHNQAKNNLTTYGSQIEAKIKGVSGNVTKSEVIKDFDKLLEKNVTLDDSQVNLILKQIAKIPEKMSIADANRFKQDFAKLVPEKAWSEIATDQDSFRAELFKTVSSGFRRAVEKRVPTISALNEKWAIAQDMLSLASKQLAKKETQGGLGSITSVTGAIQKALSPFTSTISRTSRAILNQKLADVSKDPVLGPALKFLVSRIVSPK